ncbi:sensor histidine kinase [Solidesulfovibrio sp.]
MSLRQTAAVIVCATFFGLLLLLYAIFRGTIQNGFDGLERQAVAENLDRVQNAMARDLKNLEGMAADWGLWDDTYHFLKSQNDAYVAANLTPQSFGELHLDLLALFDTDGKLMAAKLYDAAEGIMHDAPGAVAAMTAAMPDLLRTDAWDGRRGGIAFLDGQPCLVSAQTVLTSAREGPPAGTLIMGQMLDADTVRALSELTLLDVRLLPLTGRDLPPGLAGRLAAGQGEAREIRVLGEGVVGGFVLLRDILDKPALILSVSMPRTIHHQGRLLERAVVGSLVAIGIMFGLTMLYFVERFILSRVTRLGAEITELGQGRRERVTASTGSDEVAALTRAVNTMLDDLDAARANYVLATRAAKAGVWDYLPARGTVSVDPVIAALLGYEAPGHPQPASLWLARLHDEDQGRVRQAAQTIGDNQVFELELRAVAASGQIVWFLCRGRIVPGPDGSPRQVVGTAVDITELKRAAESIRALSARLMRAQETERSTIARDLHDNVAQDLSSLKIAYETLLDGQSGVPEALQGRLEAASRILARSIASVRELSYGLRPPDMEQLGLNQALDRLCQEMAQASGLDVTYAGVGLEGLDFDYDVAINLYRITQEALANARRHAGAGRIDVRLVESYPKLILRVRDDGCGFDPGRTSPESGQDSGPTAQAGMGLVNMRERAALLGGTLRILSGPGQGTTVVAEIPYAGGRSHDDQTPADR